jgi:hypothetical protein
MSPGMDIDSSHLVGRPIMMRHRPGCKRIRRFNGHSSRNP